MFLLLVVILLTIIFVYIKLKYFTLYGPIPGKSPHFLFGNILQTGLARGRYFGDISKELQDKYGDIFQIWFGRLHLICICDPNDVQHIFTHRHIYEKSNLHLNQYRIAFNDALIANIGT
jgi:hypothetical protein